VGPRRVEREQDGDTAMVMPKPDVISAPCVYFCEAFGRERRRQDPRGRSREDHAGFDGVGAIAESRLGADGLHDSESGLVGIAFEGEEHEVGGGVDGDGVGFVGQVGLPELVKSIPGR